MPDLLGGIYPDTPLDDAFARVRVATPQSLFEVNHQWDLNPLLMDQIVVGSGAVALAAPVATLSVGAVNNDRIVHQSHRYLAYQPGKSQRVSITGVLAANTSSLSGMGYGDDSDGIFFEQDSTGLYVNLVSSTGQSSRVAQANWNVDKFTGSGVSGVTLDPTKAQHLVIDQQWLGVGRVRVGFFIGGRIFYAHQFDFSNSATTLYSRTASLPVRWFLKSTGTSATMSAGCASVISEGGHDPIGQFRSAGRTSSVSVGSSGSRIPLITIRPSATHNSVTNRAAVVLIGWSALSSANVFLEVITNATLTGASFSAEASANGFADVDTSATVLALGTRSEILTSGYVGVGTGNASTGVSNGFDPRALQAVLNAAGSVADTITLCASGLGSAATVFGALSWMEIR